MCIFFMIRIQYDIFRTEGYGPMVIYKLYWIGNNMSEELKNSTLLVMLKLHAKFREYDH